MYSTLFEFVYSTLVTEQFMIDVITLYKVRTYHCKLQLSMRKYIIICYIRILDYWFPLFFFNESFMKLYTTYNNKNTK